MRVFVANRGEVAVRIIRACQGLGFETVLGVSQADRDSLGARLADRVVVLGGPQASQSYLAADTVVHAAVATGCDLVHPGYGFLSEQADFAEMCAKEGLTFVGPSPEALTRLGDKLSARDLAQSVGVPVGAGGRTGTLEEAVDLAADIGYPVLVKAAFGGGGRGMKLVTDPADLPTAWTVASSEASATFGDGTVFVERFVLDAKHIEVQVIGDRHGGRLHVGERECSVQYRYQKVVEEAPGTALPDDVRTTLLRSARDLVGAVDYVGLGTVEFLYDTDRGELSFLEVNPRLQVEHPVTEAISGIDLVREQIRVCLGEPLGIAQDDVLLQGHAIEARITAQDPARRLAPSPGRITRWQPPVRGGLRLDSHVHDGYLFAPYYDALMGKLVAWGPDRETARQLLASALADFRVDGTATSLPLLRRIVEHEAFVENTVTTHWLTDLLEEGSAS
jgi:acetyl-CoA carboxylase biotin carboxylase subunit